MKILESLRAGLAAREQIQADYRRLIVAMAASPDNELPREDAATLEAAISALKLGIDEVQDDIGAARQAKFLAALAGTVESAREEGKAANVALVRLELRRNEAVTSFWERWSPAARDEALRQLCGGFNSENDALTRTLDAAQRQIDAAASAERDLAAMRRKHPRVFDVVDPPATPAPVAIPAPPSPAATPAPTRPAVVKADTEGDQL